jgi:hypothetical protein
VPRLPRRSEIPAGHRQLSGITSWRRRSTCSGDRRARSRLRCGVAAVAGSRTSTGSGPTRLTRPCSTDRPQRPRRSISGDHREARVRRPGLGSHRPVRRGGISRFLSAAHVGLTSVGYPPVVATRPGGRNRWRTHGPAGSRTS